MTSASAPAKIILFGEHAVVYDRPALAAPLPALRATAEVRATSEDGVRIRSLDTGFDQGLDDADPDQPLAAIVRLGLRALGKAEATQLEVVVQSAIPIASGLGSGAAVSIAILRALGDYYKNPMPPEQQASLAFEVERIHHGTPSGIDNTVIAHEKPVYFMRGKPLQLLRLPQPLQLVVADSGVESSTREAVSQVRASWEADKPRMEKFFDQIAALVEQARGALQSGELAAIGGLMDSNQRLLEQIGVSHPKLESLAVAARAAGAAGAKLSGAGLVCNLIAAVEAEAAEPVRLALLGAGAHMALATEIAA